MSVHTPTPWFAVKGRYNVNIVTKPKGEYEHRVAECMWWTAPTPGQPDEATCAANAAFIVLAVNSHNNLVEALEEISRLRPAGDVDRCVGARKLVERMERIALAALAAAKGDAL